ncbi:MAG TPA: pitrilysin family protein [Planctomycetota bacterium]|jgi:zinc protease|nr:pitrilysin family protein [Planctomycetota bacterium]
MPLFALVLAAPLALPPADGTLPRAVFPYAIHRETLENGLRAIVIPMPSEGLVAYWSVVRTGSRDEVEEGCSGFAHFFEHLMFRGTEKHPAGDYDRILASMGADANAFTSDDVTAYHLSFSKEDLPQVVELESDRFQNLKYAEDLFRTEAGAVYGEYRKNRTDPEEVLEEAVRAAAFERHTYRHTTIGFEADIQKMPERYAYSKGFFTRFYRPENVVLLVAGDVEPAATFALLRKAFGGWKRGYESPSVPEEPPPKAAKRIVVPFEGKTLPVLALAFRGERFLPGDRAMVAGDILGDLAFGETSPVYRRLVLEEQRLDSLSTEFRFQRDPGLWWVRARVKDLADVPAVERELWGAAEELRRAPVSRDRLDAVRSRSKYGFLSSLTTPGRVCGQLALFAAITGDVAAVEEYFATLEKVEPEDVRRAAERSLDPQRCTASLLHAKGEAPPAFGAAAAASAAPAAASLSAPPVLLPVAEDPNVDFKIWFKVGSQDDPPGKEGLAALTASLLTEGATQKNAYDAILEKLYPMAASYDASVDREMTVVTGEVHRDHLERFLPLFLDALVRPAFKADDLERLRDQALVFVEKALRYTSDEELGKAALNSRLFAGTRYAHPIVGTAEGLRSITREDVLAFSRAHFTRENVVVGVGGAYPADLPDRLAKELSALPSGRPSSLPPPPLEEPEGRDVVLVEKPGPSTAISIGVPIDLQRGSREFAALSIASNWLGVHRNSTGRLYQVLREARGLNYGDYAYVEAFPNGGRRIMPPTGVGRRRQLFEVWIRPVPRDRAIFALRGALREVDRLVERGLSKEEFEEARRFLKKYSLHYAETTSERLGYAVDDRFYGIEKGHLKSFRSFLDEATREDVNAAIRRHFSTENLVIAIVTADAKGLADALVSDAPSPIDYGADKKPPEILAEDKEIERYPLRIRREKVSIVPVDEIFARE